MERTEIDEHAYSSTTTKRATRETKRTHCRLNAQYSEVAESCMFMMRIALRVLIHARSLCSPTRASVLPGCLLQCAHN